MYEGTAKPIKELLSITYFKYWINNLLQLVFWKRSFESLHKHKMKSCHQFYIFLLDIKLII
jgi:hypothetical protein